MKSKNQEKKKKEPSSPYTFTFVDRYCPDKHNCVAHTRLYILNLLLGFRSPWYFNKEIFCDSFILRSQMEGEGMAVVLNRFVIKLKRTNV